MAPRPIDWREKVRRLIGGADGALPHGACARLARQIDVPPRQVLYWLEQGRSPRNESTVLQRIADALGVQKAWLEDGTDSAPIRVGEEIPPEVVQRVPERFRRLIFAASDPRCAEFLLAQLEIYERSLRPARGRGPS